MKLRTLIALDLTLLAVSACIVEPVGGRGYYGGGPRARSLARLNFEAVPAVPPGAAGNWAAVVAALRTLSRRRRAGFRTQKTRAGKGAGCCRGIVSELEANAAGDAAQRRVAARLAEELAIEIGAGTQA